MSMPPSAIFITSSSDKSVFLPPHPVLSYGWAIRRRNFDIQYKKFISPKEKKGMKFLYLEQVNDIRSNNGASVSDAYK